VKRTLREAERLDTHHKAILDYIKNNSQCTENQVVKAMEVEKICSKMTTLRKLDELIEMQEIKDLLKDGESGFHKFVINENNEFNKIYEELSDFEIFIPDLSKFRHMLFQQFKGEYAVDDIDFGFVGRTADLLTMFLRRLLVKTNNIKSDKDKQILYTKIIESMSKVAPLQHFNEKDIMNQLTWEIDGIKQHDSRFFSDKKESELVKQMKYLMTKVININKKILS